MKFFNLAGRRSVLLAPVNVDRAGIAKLDRDDARSRIEGEERVLSSKYGKI
jgi:hypothetical protein